MTNTSCENQNDIATNAANFFKLALHELSNNKLDLAKNYFEQALLNGHELSVRYYLFLQNSEDKLLARDIILHAENFN